MSRGCLGVTALFFKPCSLVNVWQKQSSRSPSTFNTHAVSRSSVSSSANTWKSLTNLFLDLNITTQSIHLFSGYILFEPSLQYIMLFLCGNPLFFGDGFFWIISTGFSSDIPRLYLFLRLCPWLYYLIS